MDFLEWFRETYASNGFQFDKPYQIQRLAEMSEASVYHVREALRDLVAQNLVRTKPGEGVYIVPPDPSQKLRPIGIVASEVDSIFARRFLRELFEACRENALRPIIELSFGDAWRETDAVRRLASASGGILLLRHSSQADWGAIREHARAKPVVLVEPAQNPGLSAVKMDTRAFVRGGVDHLVRQLDHFGVSCTKSIFVLADRADPETSDLLTLTVDYLREKGTVFGRRFEIRDRMRLVRLQPTWQASEQIGESRFQIARAPNIGTDAPDVSLQDTSPDLVGQHLMRQLLLELNVPRERPFEFSERVGLFCLGDGLTRGVLEALRRLQSGIVPARFLVMACAHEPPRFGSFLSRLEPDYGRMVQESLGHLGLLSAADRSIRTVAKPIPPIQKLRRSSGCWEAALWHATATGTAVIKKRIKENGRIELKYANPAFLLLNEKTLDEVRDRQPDEYWRGGTPMLKYDRDLLGRDGPLLTCEQLPKLQMAAQHYGRFTLRWRLTIEGEEEQWLASLGFRFLASDANFPIEVQQLFAQRSHFENEPPDPWLRAFFDYAPCTIAVHELSRENRLLYINLAFTYMLAGDRAAKGTLTNDQLDLWLQLADQHSTPNPALRPLVKLRDSLTGTSFGEQTENVSVGDGQVVLKDEKPLQAAAFRGIRKVLRWPLYSGDSEPVAIASLGFDRSAIQSAAERFASGSNAGVGEPGALIELPITSLGLLESPSENTTE